MDKHGKHYFIEVNSRLQVEHTVTEEIAVSMGVGPAAGAGCGLGASRRGVSASCVKPMSGFLGSSLSTDRESLRDPCTWFFMKSIIIQALRVIESLYRGAINMPLAPLLRTRMLGGLAGGSVCCASPRHQSTPFFG